jgi:hypothetical protein
MLAFLTGLFVVRSFPTVGFWLAVLGFAGWFAASDYFSPRR